MEKTLLVELINELEERIDQAKADLAKARKGNKSAAKRIRKFTLDMGKRLGKDFRRESMRM